MIGKLAIACPLHPNAETRVVDSRGTHKLGMDAVRRRRECTACGQKWTTYELRAADMENIADAGVIALNDIMKIARDALADSDL